MKIRQLNFLLALFLCAVFKSVAAPSPPQPQSIPPPVGAPLTIDSEIWILFASGVALGMYFLLKSQKSTTKYSQEHTKDKNRIKNS